MKLLIVFLIALATTGARAYRLTANEIEGRVANGADDVPGQSPFQVLLYLGNKTMCGGSILGKRHILTAAHCVERVEFGKAYMGSTVFRSGSTIREFVKDNITIHSGWRHPLLENDISIIEIEDVTFSEMIQPVQLPTSNESLVGQIVTVTGWGFTAHGSKVPKNLQTVDLPVIDGAACKSHFRTLFASTMICCDTAGGKSACNGDSGGPVVEKSSNIQVGVVSYGSPYGCTSGYPAVYTRVSSFISWIEDVLSK